MTDVGIAAATARRHVERMIGVGKELQACPLAKRATKRFDEFDRSELIAGPLQEQHRNMDAEEMIGALA